MAENHHAALRLAHPTVVPGQEDDRREQDDPDVDVTGTHPTVRATPIRGD